MIDTIGIEVILIFSVIGFLNVTIKPLMDLLEFSSNGFLFENSSIPDSLRSNSVFKTFRYLLNLITGVRL